MGKGKGGNERQQNLDAAAWNLLFIKYVKKITFGGKVSQILKFNTSQITGVVANEMLTP